MVPKQAIVKRRLHRDEGSAEVALWRLHAFSGLVLAHEKTVKGRPGADRKYEISGVMQHLP